MHTTLALIVGVALATMSLGGCDDQNGAKPHVKAARISRPTVARAGDGWHNLADGKISTWGFAGQPGETQPDSFESIRAALDARMLPPRGRVRIAELIGGITRPTLARPDGLQPGSARLKIEAMVTTSPWNDNTWLLWVSVAGLDTPPPPAIHVTFDPTSVASFRPLGDAGALPDPQSAGGRAQMLYELSPQPDGPQSAGVAYATVHVGGDSDAGALSYPIGPANFIDSIDNAPDVVRFATAVAGFAELLRGDPAVRDLSCAEMIALAESADQPDPAGMRAQTIALMRRAQPLIDQPPGDPPIASDDTGK